MGTKYIKNALKVDSAEMETIRKAAAEHKIDVLLGFAENDGNSVYIAQCLIGRDGEIKMRRRKVKPTHMERTVFGDGSGNSLKNVVEVAGVGRVGALNCWEHTQPLLKYHTCKFSILYGHALYLGSSEGAARRNSRMKAANIHSPPSSYLPFYYSFLVFR